MHTVPTKYSRLIPRDNSINKICSPQESVCVFLMISMQFKVVHKISNNFVQVPRVMVAYLQNLLLGRH